MNLTILRKYHSQGTTGKLISDKVIFRTLERPNLSNQQDNPNTKQNDSSCIPEGIYKVVPDKTGRFQYFKVLDVLNRSNIEIHPANSIEDLLGCIGIGEDIQENKYGFRFWLTNSRISCQKLLKDYPDGFTLKITSEDSECNVEYAKF